MYHLDLLPPLFIQVLLTFIVWVAMYQSRLSEIARRDLDPQKLATRREGRDQLRDSVAIADNLQNQFEMPVLFYAGILLALIMIQNDPALVALAWLFVALRAGHALIHCTYNRVVHRFAVYAGSCFALWAFWGRLGWNLYFA